MSLTEQERKKYEEAWSYDSYRERSPGERLLSVFWTNMGVQEGHSIIDFGCGTGRALKWFKEEKKMDVMGVDIAQNCLDDDVNVPLLVYPLWDIPVDLHADWGYCTDVLEHIPPIHVDEVIKNISKSVRFGCFFQIALFPHVHEGQTLHLSLMGSGQWEVILKKYFNYVNLFVEDSSKRAIFICKP